MTKHPVVTAPMVQMASNLTGVLARMDFMRLFFRDPVEGAIAYRWSRRFADLVGARAVDLRPNTTLAEMLEWAFASGSYHLAFVMVFEPELRMHFLGFLENSEETTFRDMVEYYASWFGP